MPDLPKTILISRPDAIGDVVLTLPVAGWLKQQWPGCRVVFLGRAYTRAVIEACEHVDQFVDADQLLALSSGDQVEQVRALGLDVWLHVLPHRRLAVLAQAAGVPERVGTSRRWWHWLTCNRRVSLSRKNSGLHEAELNLRLLAGVGITNFPPLAHIADLYGLTRVAPPGAHTQALLGPPPPASARRIILHPKSQGSAREWPLARFTELARVLHAAGHRVYITGTAKEGELLADFLGTNMPYITDLTGRLSLSELLGVIGACHGLVAASTGPLHVAAALGRWAVGLYPPLHPMHPGRWGPLGPHATALTTPQRTTCADCVGRPAICHCLPEINPLQVVAALAKI